MEHPLDRKWLETRLRRIDSNQARLARAMGKDRSVVNRLLNGERKLKLAEIETIAEHLHLPVAAVLEWAGVPTTDSSTRKGFAEMTQAELEMPKPKVSVWESGSKATRHPAFGALKGLITIKPGVNLTEPVFEDWKKLYGEDE